jgi:hypothetical protein
MTRWPPRSEWLLGVGVVGRPAGHGLIIFAACHFALLKVQTRKFVVGGGAPCKLMIQ